MNGIDETNKKTHSKQPIEPHPKDKKDCWSYEKA